MYVCVCTRVFVQILWFDVRKGSEAAGCINLDQNSSILVPHFDADTGLLYLCSKGDSSMRVLEWADSKLHHVDNVVFGEPHNGCAFLPKRCVDVRKCEVAKLWRATADSLQTASVTVPRARVC